jgi:hypothetical protein
METSEKWWAGSLQPLPDNCYVNGLKHIPKNYRLMEVPGNAPLRWGKERPDDIAARDWQKKIIRKGFLASSYNIPKVLISLIQAVWAIVTLYRARGNQIDTYGYTAFGLTVAPYAFMSIINIFANLVMPEYPAVFLVHTPDLDDAIRDGAVVEGVIGAVDMSRIPNKVIIEDVTDGWRYTITTLLCSFTPLIVIASLSKFNHGSSSIMQRGFIMSWYIVSIAFGAIPYWFGRENHIAWLITFWIFAAPAIGGMVMVGVEIQEYGVCTRI